MVLYYGIRKKTFLIRINVIFYKMVTMYAELRYSRSKTSIWNTRVVLYVIIIRSLHVPVVAYRLIFLKNWQFKLTFSRMFTLLIYTRRKCLLLYEYVLVFIALKRLFTSLGSRFLYLKNNSSNLKLQKYT